MFNISITVNNQGKDASALLRKTTEYKDKGKINDAINTLRKAYKEIAKTNIDYPIETFLRLPLYLQTAGQNNEAWDEFNRLLKEGYPNQNKSKEIVPMVESTIYDKMRLFLHRQKEYNKAISYGIYSILSHALGLYNQKRMEELKSYTDNEFITEKITTLLKKAKKLDLLENIIQVTRVELSNLPNISFEHFSKKIDAILS